MQGKSRGDVKDDDVDDLGLDDLMGPRPSGWVFERILSSLFD